MKANCGDGFNVLVVCVIVVLIGGSGVRADFTFGTPTNLRGAVNSSALEFLPNISADGLSLYFVSDRAGGQGDRDLWVATRPTVDDDWGQPMNLGPVVNSPYRDEGPCISADGLELHFNSYRPGGYGGGDLWVTTRATTNDEWRAPVNLGPVINSLAGDYTPNLSADGLSLYFASERNGAMGGIGDGDIWVSTRPSSSDPWGEPTNLGMAVNSREYDGEPSISHDGFALFFSSWRSDVPGLRDTYVSTRTATEGSWGAAVNLGMPINTTTEDGAPSISSDGRTLYFASLRSGGKGNGDIWQVPVIPVVDLNGDGKVDIQDLLRMINSWGEDDPSVDIGPEPFGDGTVDEKDLEVLMSYWGQEVHDPDLIAQWKLDEASGMIAVDSAGTSDGALLGNPIWRPVGGKHGGALEFDGLGSCVETPFVRDPSQGAFSIFAWVKGGAPGQSIVSQVIGANWLMLAPSGALMTELKQTGRQQGKPLTSSAVITDGAWHRVGLVWDGSNRILYVDDIEVARDMQTALAGTRTGLCVGASSTRASGTFWSGLIDDVRIYKRAVKP
jgi:Tol biopolymer transport system component